VKGKTRNVNVLFLDAGSVFSRQTLSKQNHKENENRDAAW
jgi:hypothetical protein